MQFKISKKSNKSQARLGFLETENGVVETPCLVGVATQATVKTLTSEEASQAKSQMLICNTFHLHLKPGQDIVAKAGGLHNFMNWKKPLMTDSGGFQVFSLGFGRDYGMGKVLKEGTDKKVQEGQQPQKIKITDDGVFFKSPVDGAELFLGPKESMKIQEKLGADIIFAFDECTSPIADYEYTKNSLQKTHKWAKTCLKVKKSEQALFGIVQGGKFKDLREQSAKFIGGLDFDGFGIGGEFGDDKKEMANMIGWCLQELPEKKPRHLLGIGYLEDMEQIIKAGVDTFDCTVPTHYARHGIAFTKEGKLDLNKSQFLKDREPLDADCMCFVCQNYKRNYISHLLKAKEITALRLLTFHNLFYFNTFAEKLRQDIKNGKI
jgi:queuine tRNA-ribosyltransferase/7-cyano-7-deazaguanine tRNA-ribosyltransferase